MRRQIIYLFATLRERVGSAKIEVLVGEKASVAELKIAAARAFPELDDYLPNVLVAVNQAYAFNDEEIPTDAEVAFFPPVSGGSGYPTIVEIADGALSLDEYLPKITGFSTGAICIFYGVVRGKTSRGTAHVTSELVYEAYETMAKTKMLQVADEIRERWPEVEGILIIQRIGRLAPGTPTIVIACSAAHRDTGIFEASRYGIDRLKEIVPIWKKEITPEGEIWVEGEYHPQKGD